MPPRDPACLQLQTAHLNLLRELLAHYTPDAEVWAYGSRVNGGGHEASDLDLVLRWPADLSQDVPHWDELKEAIQNSQLPIVVDLHQWSRLPKTFHADMGPRKSGNPINVITRAAMPLFRPNSVVAQDPGLSSSQRHHLVHGSAWFLQPVACCGVAHRHQDHGQLGRR